MPTKSTFSALGAPMSLAWVYESPCVEGSALPNPSKVARSVLTKLASGGCRMKEITIKTTPSETKKAIAALKRADNDAGYAKDLKARLIAAPPGKNEMLDALRVLVAHALTNPGGNVERILRKRGFLVPEITSWVDFSEGSH